MNGVRVHHTGQAAGDRAECGERENEQHAHVEIPVERVVDEQRRGVDVHADLRQDVQQQVQAGDVDAYPLSTESPAHVFRQRRHTRGNEYRQKYPAEQLNDGNGIQFKCSDAKTCDEEEGEADASFTFRSRNQRGLPFAAPELARPMKCSAPMFDANRLAPMHSQDICRLARK